MATPQVFNVSYVPTSALPGTANLTVIWYPNGKTDSYAITYDSGGNAQYGYALNGNDIEQIEVPTIPAPFVVSTSANSVSVANGSPGTVTVTIAVNNPVSSRMGLSASGLPVGATAKFSPAAIAAPGAGTSTMTISAAATAAAGTYPITITATAKSGIYAGITQTTPYR